MRAISREPPGDEGRDQTRNKGSVSSDCPSVWPGRLGVELRTPSSRRGRRRPGASCALNKAEMTAPGALSSSSLNSGVWKLQKAILVRVLAQLPFWTGTPAAAPSDLAPSAGLGGRSGLRGRRSPPALGRGSGTLPWGRKTAPRSRGGGTQFAFGVGKGAWPPSGGRGGERSTRAPAGTWEGAERSGVGAQGPVAHSRNELQAEDLLQEPGRPLAAAAPLVLHPAAIHRRGMGQSVRSVAVARSDGQLRSPFIRRLGVTFGQGPLPPAPTALSSDGPFLQSERAADGGGGARVVPAPHVA